MTPCLMPKGLDTLPHRYLLSHVYCHPIYNKHGMKTT